jgi:DsbC/DsbD-like thiol-disulfide interchange protein
MYMPLMPGVTMRSTLRLTSLLPLLLFAGLPALHAQDVEEFPTAKVTGTFAGPASPGGQATLAFLVEMTPGFWGYHKDTTEQGFGFAPVVHFDELHGIELAETRWPAAERKEIDLDWVEQIFRDQFTLTFIFNVPEGATPGEYSIAGRYELQVCDDDG